MINVVYADTAAENTEAVSEMVQEAEEKVGIFKQYATELLDWCMSKAGQYCCSNPVYGDLLPHCQMVYKTASENI